MAGVELEGWVVPRVRRVGASASLRLDSVVGELLEAGRGGAVAICGGAGAGKSTAVRFLAATFAEEVASGSLRVSDERRLTSSPMRPVDVVTFERRAFAGEYEIAPWTADDCMEYVASRRREACGEVLGRVAGDESFRLLGGCPELVARVLDAWATGVEKRPAIAVVGELLWGMVEAEDRASLALEWGVPLGSTTAAEVFAGVESVVLGEGARRWWRHGAVQRYFAARWLIDVALSSGMLDRLARLMQWNVLPEAVFVARAHPDVVATVDRAIGETPSGVFVPVAASMMLGVSAAWRPREGGRINLEGAYLAGAKWAGMDLRGATLAGADLSGADLSGANLEGVEGRGANLGAAKLAGASLVEARFVNADLRGADLAGASAAGIRVSHADLSGANLAGAKLSWAKLNGTRLDSADLTATALDAAHLEGATVDGASLRTADLSRAVLMSVDLSKAELSGARFHGANLARCNLENVEMPGADFESANLTGALMTGSRMSRGRFGGAILRHAGLAEIEWPGASLARADLHKASFHLGSSRSGLVGTAAGAPRDALPASEGSRTGFYTDDRDEQNYKAPEEIRKANLTLADFTGARTKWCDFYLVDLRGVVCSEEQRKHFARTGAIVSEAGGSTR